MGKKNTVLNHFRNNLKGYPGYWTGSGKQYRSMGFYTHFLTFSHDNDNRFRLEGMCTTGKNLYDTGFITGDAKDLMDMVRVFVTYYDSTEEKDRDEFMAANFPENNIGSENG